MFLQGVTGDARPWRGPGAKAGRAAEQPSRQTPGALLPQLDHPDFSQSNDTCGPTVNRRGVVLALDQAPNQGMLLGHYFARPGAGRLNVEQRRAAVAVDPAASAAESMSSRLGWL